jgi:nucleotide-binding universal stress UspA family protein
MRQTAPSNVGFRPSTTPQLQANNQIMGRVALTAGTSTTQRRTPSPAAFRRIAACVESTRDLPGAVAAVRALAAARSARVLILHLNVSSLTATVFPESASRRDIESDVEARALVDGAVHRLRRSGVNASGQVVRSGWQTAAALLLDAASAFRSDLILVTPVGRTGLAALIEGSVSHQLLQRAACPVLCIPPGCERLDLRRLAVAWDGSPLARTALKVGEQLARVYGSELTLIHVADKGLPANIPASRPKTFVTVIERGSDSVTEALNRAASESGAGIVVIGSHGRGDLAAMVVGSVTHNLLAISERPVLVVRSR